MSHIRTVPVGGGASLSAEVRGQGSPPILFVHGFPLDRSLWAAQAEEFSRTHLVVAPDLRGFGGSGLGDGVEALPMDLLADDLAELLDALAIDEPAVVCGLSMGGYVAMAFARRHPGRLRGLVLADTAGGADSPEKKLARAEQAAKTLAEGSGVMWEAMKGGLFGPDAADKAPAAIERAKAMILGSRPEAVAAALRGMAERPDSFPGFAAIEVPALVLVGEGDRLTPPEAARSIAKAIPGARIALIPDAGHLAPMENPKAFNAEMAAFLADL